MTRIADDTQRLDATAQAELVASGDVAASELVDAAIERIEGLDTHLNDVVLRWYDQARERALEIDQNHAAIRWQRDVDPLRSPRRRAPAPPSERRR